MFLSSIFIITGFVLLIKCAEFLVDGSSSLAKRMAISEIAIGLTIVAFGTSAPELIVNVIASIKGYDDISFGNIIGSNVFNTLMVLGVAGLISPIIVQKNTVLKEIPFLLIATILVFLLVNNFGFEGSLLSRLDGFILLVGLAVFLIYVSKISKVQGLEVDIRIFSLWKSIIFIIIGVTGLFVGGNLVVKHAVRMAQYMNVSDKFIALTIVALGTSLPELVTSVIAVRKRHFDMAIGNVVGSNIFNLFLVLGTSSLIKPISYDLMLNLDFYLLIFITIIFFLTLFVGKKHRLDKLEATFFLLLYVAYMVFLFYREQ